MNIDELVDIEIPQERRESKEERKPIKINLTHPVWLFYLVFFAAIGASTLMAVIIAIIIQL